MRGFNRAGSGPIARPRDPSARRRESMSTLLLLLTVSLRILLCSAESMLSLAQKQQVERQTEQPPDIDMLRRSRARFCCICGTCCHPSGAFLASSVEVPARQAHRRLMRHLPSARGWRMSGRIRASCCARRAIFAASQRGSRRAHLRPALRCQRHLELQQLGRSCGARKNRRLVRAPPPNPPRGGGRLR